MIDDTESAEANGSGGNTPAVVPALDEMINASFNGGTSGEKPTSLDKLTITFSKPADSVAGDDDDDDVPAASVVIGEPRKRGRPKGSTNAATGVATQRVQKKADLAKALEDAQKELADLRARNDEKKVAELAANLKLASYFGFHFAAETRGSHWEITEDEANEIGDSGAVALAPWADKIAKHLPWGVFAMSLAKALKKRTDIDRKTVARLKAEGQIQ